MKLHFHAPIGASVLSWLPYVLYTLLFNVSCMNVQAYVGIALFCFLSPYFLMYFSLNVNIIYAPTLCTFYIKIMTIYGFNS